MEKIWWILKNYFENPLKISHEENKLITELVFMSVVSVRSVCKFELMVYVFKLYFYNFLEETRNNKNIITEIENKQHQTTL